jgi:RNA recognition motif-containing protein
MNPLYSHGASQQHGDQMKLLIRNLSRSTTQAAIRAMFETYGAVQSCTLIIDKETGESKGFGFVEMPKPGEAKAAMKALNGTDVEGSKIRVKKAVPKPDAEKP